MPSFKNKKYLRVVVTLGDNSFPNGENVITLQGFRTSIYIDHAGGVQMSTLRARVYGVKQDDMNAITTLQWRLNQILKNTITVTAIDGDSETVVFIGSIINAWGNYQGMPEVFLEIQAQAAFVQRLTPIPPTSVKGVSSVSATMKQLATTMGFNFEDAGVNVTGKNIYLSGNGLEQAKELAHMAKIDMYIDGNTLAIAPHGQPRKNDAPLISAATGMIGYPTFDSTGVNFQTLFNPAIMFGGSIQIESDITQASGAWVVTSVAHQLDSEVPHGRWFSYVRGNQNGLAVTKR